jgi:hypothetical protein
MSESDKQSKTNTKPHDFCEGMSCSKEEDKPAFCPGRNCRRHAQSPESGEKKRRHLESALLPSIVSNSRCSNVQNRDCAADVVNIKISKFGGLTKAKQAIDLCSDLGIAMTIEGRTQRESILLKDDLFLSNFCRTNMLILSVV